VVGPRLPDQAAIPCARRPPGRYALRAARAEATSRVVLLGRPPSRSRGTLPGRGGPDPRDPRAASRPLRGRGRGAEHPDDAPLVSGTAMAASDPGRGDRRAGCAKWPTLDRPIGRPPANHQPTTEAPPAELLRPLPTASSDKRPARDPLSQPIQALRAATSPRTTATAVARTCAAGRPRVRPKTTHGNPDDLHADDGRRGDNRRGLVRAGLGVTLQRYRPQP
jgi:hypothetical protein